VIVVVGVVVGAHVVVVVDAHVVVVVVLDGDGDGDGDDPDRRTTNAPVGLALDRVPPCFNLSWHPGPRRPRSGAASLA
jgi:hypothetical protein